MSTALPSLQAEPGVEAEEPVSPARSHRRRGWMIDICIMLLAILAGAFGTKAFIGSVYAIPSGSMEPTLAIGERVITEKISYWRSEPARGDVVVFDGTGLFSSPTPGSNTFVKRVVGVANDHVVCCDARGGITINGQPLDESGYLHPDSTASDIPFNVQVPPGKLWVMGDHRAVSADSRSYLGAPGGGFVPVDRVVGRVMAVGWPISSARAIDSNPH